MMTSMKRCPFPRALFFLAALCIPTSIAPRASEATPAAYDHIVIVMEENKGLTEVIGNSAEAPYINSVLVAGGASMANMFALTDPSQPNYLQFFSGSNQGVIDNTVPAPGTPFVHAKSGRSIAGGRKIVCRLLGRLARGRLDRRTERFLCPQAQPLGKLAGAVADGQSIAGFC